MAVHVHLGKTHLHLHDQSFPVPLDPDLLAIALRMPPHMIKQIYELQAERDRSKFQGFNVE